MFLPENPTFDDLDALQIEAEERGSGFIAVRLGLMCSLYIRDAHAPEVRTRLAQCADQYQALFGEYLKLYKKPDGTGKPKPYPKGGINLSEYVRKKDSPDKDYSAIFYGD